VVGDSHGLSQDVRDAADFTWALSPLTLQGDLAWLVLWEQVYRAVTLNKGIPYHHD
jgi:23S rRNA (pseudouridine1915-N3)-methyltransferase